jgi:hypothetical protein
MWFLRLKTAICVTNTTRLTDAALEVGRLTDVVCVYSGTLQMDEAKQELPMEMNMLG